MNHRKLATWETEFITHEMLNEYCVDQVFTTH